MSKPLQFSVANNTDKFSSQYPILLTIHGDYDDIQTIVSSSAYQNLQQGKKLGQSAMYFKSQGDFSLVLAVKDNEIINCVQRIVNDTNLSYDETSLGDAVGAAARIEENNKAHKR